MSVTTKLAPGPLGAMYPMKVVEFARRCHAGGHSVYAIQTLVERHHGTKPSWRTVKAWVDDDYAEAERVKRRKGGRVGRGALPAWRRRLLQCQEWRDIGLSFDAIAKLCAYHWDLRLNDDQVRRILRGRTKQVAVRELLTVGRSTHGRPVKVMP